MQLCALLSRNIRLMNVSRYEDDGSSRASQSVIITTTDYSLFSIRKILVAKVQVVILFS